MKLDTAADILEWAREMDWTCVECYTEGPCVHDTETAETLALAMRVLAEVKSRSKGAGHCAGDGCTYCPAVADYCRHILKEAKETK